MRKHPAYTFAAVLEMHAVTFYMALNNSFRMDAEEYSHQFQMALVSGQMMKKNDIMRLQSGYTSASRDILETISDADDYSGIEQLKGILQGK